MLCGHTGSSSIRSSEDHRNVYGTGGHVECFGSRVDDLSGRVQWELVLGFAQIRCFERYVINGLHGEVEGHELANRTQTGHGSTDGNTGEAHFGDGRVDHSLVAVFFPQTTGYLKVGERGKGTLG